MRLFYFVFLLFLVNPVFSQKFKAKQVYKSLNDKSLSFEAFYYAYKVNNFFCQFNSSVITIIDFSKPSSEKRFYVIDLVEEKIVKKTYVAHGMGSGANYAEKFSNTPGSKMSSAGFYLTDKTYNGKHGYSLKLRGLEEGINDNAYKRAIVIHGAWYVSEEFIKKNGRLGRSWGCPALEENEAKEIIDLIKNKTLLFIYTNDKDYFFNSEFVD